MRGRLPSGPEFVESVSGSDLAKQRARVLLETIAGTCRVQEACLRLGISEPRFDQLRIQGVEHLVQSLEPRRAGRPARMPSAAEERIRQLQEQVHALQMQVQIAQARAEIALVLPNAVHDVPNNAVAANEPGKKTRRRRKAHRPRRRAPAARKPT